MGESSECKSVWNGWNDSHGVCPHGCPADAVTGGFCGGFIGYVRDLRNKAPIHVSASANFGRIIGGSGATLVFENCFAADAVGYDVAGATDRLTTWARSRRLTTWKMGKVGSHVAPVLGAGPAGSLDPAGGEDIVEIGVPAFSGASGLAPKVLLSGDFSVSVTNAVDGVTYGVYVSDTLTNPKWQRVQTVVAAADGLLSFVVAASHAPSCFVKALVEPGY